MRIKIKEINQYFFSTKVLVRITDLNYGNHLSNEKMLSFAQQARVDYLNSLGYGELTFAGKGIIMTDAAVVYTAEVHASDLLEIKLGIDDLSEYGFDFYYKISNHATGKVVANVKTGILCFDYTTQKIAKIPTVIAEILKKLP